MDGNQERRSIRRRSQKLKVLAPYGMSVAKNASVAHRLEVDMCRVVWFDGKPEKTIYTIKFLCTRARRTGPVRLFRKMPKGIKMCEACKDPVEIFKWRAINARTGGRR